MHYYLPFIDKIIQGHYTFPYLIKNYVFHANLENISESRTELFMNITKDEQSREITINLDKTKTILSLEIKQDYDNPHENDINKNICSHYSQNCEKNTRKMEKPDKTKINGSLNS